MTTNGEPASPPPTPRPAGQSRPRQRLWLVLKLLVTGGLVAWIVGLVDWGEFWAVLSGMSLWVIGAVLLMRLGGVTASAFKWQQLLVVHGVRYRPFRLLRWYLVGSFLNLFLPSSIGGDGYRIYKTWHNERGKPAAVLAVLLERATGLAALALLGYAAALVTYLRSGGPVATAVVETGALVLLAGLLMVFVSARLRRARWLTRSRYWRYVEGLGSFARDFRRNPGRMALVAVVSLAFHLNKLLVVWLLLHTLGARVSPYEVMTGLLVVELASLLPISLGGLGLMEASFILVMGQVGVPEEVGLATMLLLRVLMVPLHLVGGVFYFFGGGRDDTEELKRSGSSRTGVAPAAAD